MLYYYYPPALPPFPTLLGSHLLSTFALIAITDAAPRELHIITYLETNVVNKVKIVPVINCSVAPHNIVWKLPKIYHLIFLFIVYFNLLSNEIVLSDLSRLWHSWWMGLGLITFFFWRVNVCLSRLLMLLAVVIKKMESKGANCCHLHHHCISPSIAMWHHLLG